MNGNRLTLAVAVLSLFVAVAALIGLGVSSPGSRASAESSEWVFPPGLRLSAKLSYLRVDGLDFRVGDNVTAITVLGAAHKWVEFEIVYKNGETVEVWVEHENVQMFTVSPKQPKPEQSDDNSNSGG